MAHNLKNIATDKMRKAGVSYKFIDVPETFPLLDTVITQVFRTEAGLIAIQKPVNSVVDFKKLKEIAGVEKLALEQTDAPLIGLEMPYFVDEAVLKRKGIYGNSGDPAFILTLDARALVKLNNATVGNFAKKEDNSNMKKRVFSGIRANARPHIGNYLGAVKGMVELQDEFDCIFSVVDLHTITTPYDVVSLRPMIRDIVLDYLGAGLDPKKCHIIIQSDLRAEHLELAYYLATIYQVSRLEDLPTYKEKKADHPDYINMGLLYYPVLMAADILVYKSSLVPIGQDQEPHLEVTREMARKFNTVFGETFPEPQSYKTPGKYVPSLLGEGKMSKTHGGTIILTDTLEEIKSVLAKAVTDSGKGEKFPEAGPAANLVTFVELFQGRDRAQQLREQYKATGIRYGDLKAELAEAIFNELTPIQERRKYFEEHPELVEGILAEGKEYSQKIAQETLLEVREKMGLT